MYHRDIGSVIKLPPLDHDGIEYGGEQASVIHFCHKGKWLRLPGAD
jgi:hypothetical protein